MPKATTKVKAKPARKPVKRVRSASPGLNELNDSLDDFLRGSPLDAARPSLPPPVRVIPSEPLPRPRKRRRKNRLHPILIQIQKRQREIAKLKATAKMLGVDTSKVDGAISAKPTGRARKAAIAAKIHAPL